MAEGVEAGCAHVDCTVLVTQENMMGELVFGEVYGRANGVKEGGTGGYEGGVVWFLVWRKGMMGWLVGCSTCCAVRTNCCSTKQLGR
jgi:hypothetical protein